MLEAFRLQHPVQGCNPRCCPRTSPSVHSSYFFLINSGRYWEHEPLHHTTGGIQPLVHAWSFKETPETAPKRCKQELREQPFLPSGCSKQSPSRGDFRKLPALIASPAALGSGSRVAPQPLTLLSSMCVASPDPPRRSPCTRSRRNRPPARSYGGHRRSRSLRAARGRRHHPPPCLCTAEERGSASRAVHAGKYSPVRPRRH